jgi:hypothetical protein
VAEPAHPGDRRPILVTGVPRSGTTWLARWLAHGRGMALAGREPMNPRGRQYALGGTLPGWARLTEPTARQRRGLALAYRGLNPFVYSRYGTRQWAAPWPGTRMVIKDPFAVLSIPAVVRVTSALPVLVYRHPGAVLASYRRMGWTTDLDEVQRLVEQARAEGGPDLPDLPRDGEVDDVEAMARFWSTLHTLALEDAAATGTKVLVVAHSELAASDPDEGRAFADTLGIRWTPAMAAELAPEDEGRQETEPPAEAETVSSSALHRFDRAPSAVADAWRRHVAPADLERIEAATEPVRARLDSERIPLRAHS